MTRLTPTRYRRALRPRSSSDVDALLHSALSNFPSLGTGLDLDSFFRPTTSRLPVEVAEKEDHYLLRAEVPGVKRDFIEVTIDGRILSLEVFASRDEGDAEASEGERTLVRSRRLTLPESVNAAEVSASLEDGILALTLPKVPTAKARVIEIA